MFVLYVPSFNSLLTYFCDNVSCYISFLRISVIMFLVITVCLHISVSM